MVAMPDTVGVHWKTRSGAVAVEPQLPARPFAPLVVPVKVPPAAGITVGLLHAPAGTGVVVVLVGVVDVVVGGVGAAGVVVAVGDVVVVGGGVVLVGVVGAAA